MKLNEVCSLIELKGLDVSTKENCVHGHRVTSVRKGGKYICHFYSARNKKYNNLSSHTYDLIYKSDDENTITFKEKKRLHAVGLLNFIGRLANETK